MASLVSISILFFLVFLAFSIPSQSEKTELSTKKKLTLSTQVDEREDKPIIAKSIKKKKLTLTEDDEEQPITSKPAIKKKKLALLEDEEQPITTKSIVKKKKLTPMEDEEQPIITKSSLKKKKLVPMEDEDESTTTKSTIKKKKIALTEEENQPISTKSLVKKKKVSPIEQEEQPITTKSTLKKKKLAPVEDEEQSIATKSTLKKKKLALKDEEDQPITATIKKKKLALVKDDEDQPIKKKKLTPTNNDEPLKKKKIAQFNNESTPKNQTKLLKPKTPKSNSTTTTKPVNPDPIWMDDPSEDEDLISEFRDLPTRIHKAFLPDLKKISITSKAYIYRANRELTSKVKPFVGKNFAPKIALTASCLFLLLPLVLVTLLFYHLNSYLSLQRLLVFAQAYLAIYFLTLSITAVATGLEPLRFFYATSPASYAWTQAVQTLAYVLYLLVQLINLLVVFSAGEGGVGPKALGLAQVVVGLAVGLHYYSAVFHRAVTGDPPKANWKVHGVYAVCFLVICLFASVERRKKAYDGGEDGKVN